METSMLQHVPAPLGRALSRLRAGEAALAVNQEAFAALPATVQVTSSEFVDGAPLASVHTADGKGRSPALSWQASGAARSVALLVEDADSPSQRPFVHAIAWNLPSSGTLAVGDLDADGPAALGVNSYRRLGWLPPDPPTGHGPHSYVFQLFALDQQLSFAAPPDRETLLKGVKGHVLATGRLTGTYERAAGRSSLLPIVAVLAAGAALFAMTRRR